MGTMKLWEVTNGWMGCSYMRVVVIAPDEETALAMAADQFTAVDSKYIGSKMQAGLCCGDLTKPWVSRPSDEGIDASDNEG